MTKEPNKLAAPIPAIELRLHVGRHWRGIGEPKRLASSAMRLYFAIVCAVLLVGCQAPNSSRDETVRIAGALERRITADEARHILFDDIDRAVQTARARSGTNEDARVELAVLSRQRQRLSATFDSFLDRSRTGDELWAYRTYVTADRRGGENGLALIRDGRVIEHMEIMIYD